MIRVRPASRNVPLIGRLAALALFALFALLAPGCAGPEPPAIIAGFTPASGTYYPGDVAASSVEVENAGPERRTFWVGYSVRDGAGEWHDAPSAPVTLNPGEKTGPISREWEVPEDPLLTTGPYGVKMAVWDSRPEEGGASRLAEADAEDSFRVGLFEAGFESLDSLDGGRWEVVDRGLGRGRLDPDNVAVTGDGRLRITSPADTLDGGAVRSEKLYRYGTYRARMKTPEAPSSITAFFLYAAPDYEKEIDIEIYNDGSRRVMFSVYSPTYGPDGNLVKEPTRTETKELPFDPSAGFHEYRFDFYPQEVIFYVDGEPMQSWSEGLPGEPMNVWVNTWFPDWLSGSKPARDRYTYVDWIEH